MGDNEYITLSIGNDTVVQVHFTDEGVSVDVYGEWSGTPEFITGTWSLYTELPIRRKTKEEMEEAE